MKKDFCEIVVVIDESGSMHSVKGDTIGGFNTFINTHKKLPGEANLTLVKFDTGYKILYNGVNIKDVKPLNESTYTPGGMTALLDAVGTTIDEVVKRREATPEDEKAEKVIFMIITDGEENSSREYTDKKKIKEKVEHLKTTEDWEFVFLGADQDAWAAGGGMGVHNSVNFRQSDMRGTMNKMSYYSSNVRMKSSKTSMDNFNLSDDEINKELDNLTSGNNT